MRHALYRLGAICTLLCIIAGRVEAAPRRARAVTPAATAPTLEFDRGTKKGARQFESVERCTIVPCVVTQHGAWRFPRAVVGDYRITMGFVRDGAYLPITLFQESTTLEQKLSERLLNRYPNRKIVNLTRMVETGEASIIYMFGVLLQYDLKEGNPISVVLTDLRRPERVFEYYFRFHRTGTVPDVDIAFTYPISVFHPNPNYLIQGAQAGAAFSFSFGRHMDPERRYGLLPKLARAVRLNLFLGLLSRKEAVELGGDLVVKDFVDGFAGAGVTFFNFINAGYGVNIVRSPHSFFPFVGIEVRHAFEFLRTFKRDTHSRWQHYLKAEEAR